MKCCLERRLFILKFILVLVSLDSSKLFVCVESVFWFFVRLCLFLCVFPCVCLSIFVFVGLSGCLTVTVLWAVCPCFLLPLILQYSNGILMMTHNVLEPNPIIIFFHYISELAKYVYFAVFFSNFYTYRVSKKSWPILQMN